tara:strand:- start:673 stop:930 length:258 start_codon:yes stop_codon:yes gene_type:complete
VCITANRKVVGSIIENREGKWKNAILTSILVGIPLLEPLLINSTKSTKKNNKQLKVKIIRIELKFFLNKYFKISCDLIIKYFYTI